jgi:hypothetical protein
VRISSAGLQIHALLVRFIHTHPGLAFFRDTHDPEDLRVASHLAIGRVSWDLRDLRRPVPDPAHRW